MDLLNFGDGDGLEWNSVFFIVGLDFLCGKTVAGVVDNVLDFGVGGLRRDDFDLRNR